MPRHVRLSNAHQDQLRARFRSAPLQAPPATWRPLAVLAVGGLTGVGFGLNPDSGEDLILVTSHQGRGVVDCVTGERVARDPDPEPAWPDDYALTCAGIGPLVGVAVQISGLMGGGLHTTTMNRWTLHVVAPDWPNESVLLSKAGGPYRGEAGSTWWHIHRELSCEIRAAGFSPTGRTLTIASSCTLTLFAQPLTSLTCSASVASGSSCVSHSLILGLATCAACA